MQDHRTWFIDAHSGELVHQLDHVYAESAVGFGSDGQDSQIFSIVNIDELVNASFVSAPSGPQGTGALVFGESPGGPPFVPLDVVAHEFMHGVTHSALTARTGLPLFGQHLFTLGPSSFRVSDEVIRCGDLHTFPDDPDEVVAP